MKGSPRCIYISSNMAACRSPNGQEREGAKRGEREGRHGRQGGKGRELSRRACCPMLFCSDQNVRQRFWSCTVGYMWSGALALALDLDIIVAPVRLSLWHCHIFIRFLQQLLGLHKHRLAVLRKFEFIFWMLHILGDQDSPKKRKRDNISDPLNYI